MNLGSIIALHNSVFDRIERMMGPWLLPTLARFVFAAVLFQYFWLSGVSKIDFGSGFFGFLSPTAGGFAQIFPKAAELVLYDTSQASFFQTIVILFGGYTELLFPLLIVLGLFTRLASVGMIGFIVVQSLTDLFAHGGIAHKETLGAWFDRASDSAILDQRAFWVVLLIILVVRGAGPLSLDALLRGRTNAQTA